MKTKISIDEYLGKMAQFADSDYGRVIREQFADLSGSSELGMLASPTAEELQQLQKAVAIMTEAEKQNAAELTDEQVERIADDAGIDKAVFAIFINGYAIENKRVS